MVNNPTKHWNEISIYDIEHNQDLEHLHNYNRKRCHYLNFYQRFIDHCPSQECDKKFVAISITLIRSILNLKSCIYFKTINNKWRCHFDFIQGVLTIVHLMNWKKLKLQQFKLCSNLVDRKFLGWYLLTVTVTDNNVNLYTALLESTKILQFFKNNLYLQVYRFTVIQISSLFSFSFFL